MSKEIQKRFEQEYIALYGNRKDLKIDKATGLYDAEWVDMKYRWFRRGFEMARIESNT